MRLSLDGSSSARQPPPGASGPHGRSASHNPATPLPNKYSGPGGPSGPPSPNYSPAGSGAAVNHVAGRQVPPHQASPMGGYADPQTPPSRRDSAGPHQGFGHSITPGPRHGAEPYGREGGADSSPYALPNRPQSSLGGRQQGGYSGNQPSPLSAQQRLNATANPPGPQHPYHPSSSQGRGDYSHRFDQYGNGPSPSTPMARIPPQTKATPANASPGVGRPLDPATAAQRTTVGDETSPQDRPKQNSVWYEYGCV
jgi:hypothetical protein